MSTLRVLHVCQHTDPYDPPGSGDVGGMNVYVRATVEAMAALGHEVDVVTRSSWPDAPPVETPAPGVRVRRLPAGPAQRLPKGAHEALIAPFARLLRDLSRPDVVHSHHWFSGAAALPVARQWGVPHVQSFHSIAADPETSLAHGERPESPGRLAGEAMLARDSDLVVAVSRAEARTVEERLEGRRSVVVPPGVDSELFRPGEPAPGRGSVVVATRLEPLKGIELAIEALARVPAAKRPLLVVAGGATSPDGSYRAELVDRAADRGVEARFVGPLARRELAESLRGARMLLVPSHSETYGLVALEAAASGIPVVATTAGGLVEAVADGQTGLLLDTRDPEAWARVVERLMDDAELAARLGAAGRRHALDHGWETTAEGLLAAYRQVRRR